MKTFGINGFGRIGRTSFRVWWQKHADQLDLRLINTSGSMELEEWVHLIKYDSNYGVFAQPISFTQTQTKAQVTDANPVLGEIHLGPKSIFVTAQRDPVKVPWGKYGVQTVIEATGVFNSEEKASLHLQGGAQNVIISGPAKGGTVPTAIIGVNTFAPNSKIVSNASCTTNCVGPVAAILHSKFGVKKAMMSTVHAYTDDQNLHDNSHKDMRRARAAAQNIVPTSTGAAVSVTEIIPELKGLFDGISYRVPTAVGSISDMVFVLARPTTVDEINKVFIEASQLPQWKGILAVSDDGLVSSDIKGRPESSIVDLSLTQVIDGDLVKVVSWYDNEFGYCNRLVEQVSHI